MEEEKRQEEARRKMTLIAPLLDPYLTKGERRSKEKEIAERNDISQKTVHRYYMSYTNGGYNALLPLEQSRPERRAIPVAVLHEAIELLKELPSRSVETIIDVLEIEGMVEEGSVKRPTLQRNLQEAGWGKKQIADRTFASDKAALRFSKRHRMQLVQADIKYGPEITIKGRTVKTYLLAWIDDFSRYILGGTLFSSQTSFDVHRSFRRMIETYGKPVMLLCDNGSQYIAKILKDTCLRLGIIIRYAPPRAANVKGKIERFNKDVSKFVAEAKLEGFKTLEKLNSYYIAWEAETHQEHNHSALDGGKATPKEIFEGDALNTPLNYVSKEDLDEAFLQRVSRKVHTDGTFSLFGRLYEVDNYNLRGFRVDVYYDYTSDKVVRVCNKDFGNAGAKPFKEGEDIDYGLKNKIRNEGFKKKEAEIPKDHGSRVLRAYNKRNGSLHPDLQHYDCEEIEEEAEAEKRPASAINFGALNNKEKDK